MPKKKKEPQPSDLANTIAEHLTNVRKLVLDADQLAHQASQEINAIKRLLSKEQ